MRNRQKHTGYAALMTVMTLGAVLVIVSISTSFASINQLQTSLSQEKSSEALYVAEACIEEALLSLGRDNSIPDPIVLPEGTCSVTIDSPQSGSEWIFTVSTQIETYTRHIQAQATAGEAVTIQSWQEVDE